MMEDDHEREREMRESKAPTFDTIEQLSEYIDGLVEQDHDYGTCVYALSLASVAAFNYVASRLGVTGFQASCAGLNIVKRIRRIDGPFAIVNGEDLVYPQYDLLGQVAEYIDEWSPWAADEARKNLAKDTEHVAPRVLDHWRMLDERFPAAGTASESTQ